MFFLSLQNEIKLESNLSDLTYISNSIPKKLKCTTAHTKLIKGLTNLITLGDCRNGTIVTQLVHSGDRITLHY